MLILIKDLKARKVRQEGLSGAVPGKGCSAEVGRGVCVSRRGSGLNVENQAEVH